MPRPRKNPDDPKWQTPELPPPELPTNCKPWDLYFAAALTGLIARGGTSMDALIKTARQYADEALKATEGL